MRTFLTTALAIAVAAVAPAAAHASTVGVDGGVLTFAAGPGEANDVTLRPGASTLTLTDTGAAITPLSGCSSVSANEVTCAAAGVATIDASTGDDDDRFSMNEVVLPARLDGQAGADHLHGGKANDTLIGGGGGNDNLNGDAGADLLVGADGNDNLNGGPGADTLVGALGGDILKGGGEIDTVDYSARTEAVTADPDGVADDGAAGEADNVATDVEVLVGGSGGDRLDAAPTRATTLVGGPGADVLTGAGGSDTIVSRDHFADSIVCGGSSDTVTADFLDVTPTDCETVARANPAADGEAGPSGDTSGQGAGTPGSASTGAGTGAAVVQPVQIAGPSTLGLSRAGLLPIRVNCATAEDGCTGTIEILDAGSGSAARSTVEATRRRKVTRRSLGRRKFAIRAGSSKTIQVRLSRRGRRFVIKKKKRKTRAKVVITTKAPDGTEFTTVKRVWIKPPAERRSPKRL